jgi:hypothetical protein
MVHIYVLIPYFIYPMLCSGSLSPQHGPSSGCRWRRRFPNMEGTCEYIEQVVRTAEKGDPPACGFGEGLTTPHRKKNKLFKKCYKESWNWQDRDQWRVLMNIPVEIVMYIWQHSWLNLRSGRNSMYRSSRGVR